MRVPIPPINKLIHLNTFSLQSLASFTLNFYFLFLLPSSKHSHEDRKTGRNMWENNPDRSFPGRLSISKLPTTATPFMSTCTPSSVQHLEISHAYSSHTYFLLLYVFPCFPSFILSLTTFASNSFSKIYNFSLQTKLAQEERGNMQSQFQISIKSGNVRCLVESNFVIPQPKAFHGSSVQ